MKINLKINIQTGPLALNFFLKNGWYLTVV